MFELKWWEGPEWLRQDPALWPQENLTFDEEEIMREKRKKITISFINSEANWMISDDWHLTYFASYTKTIRMIAWLFRFLKNVRCPLEKCSGEISIKEIEISEVFVFKLVQTEAFGGIDHAKIRTLHPFIDQRGLIRLKLRVSTRRDSKLFRYPIVP